MHAHPTSSACGAHCGTFISNPPPRKGYTDLANTSLGHWAGGGFTETAMSSYAQSWLRDQWWYVIRFHFPSSWANYTLHLIEYVHLITLLCLMKQVRWELWGHMGGNKKVIEQSERAGRSCCHSGAFRVKFWLLQNVFLVTIIVCFPIYCVNI